MASNDMEVLESAATTGNVEASASGIAVTRRQLMSALTVAGAAAGIALVSGPSAVAQQPIPNGYNQIDVMNFLLNVKYLTATLYSYVTQGTDLPASSFTTVGTGGVFNAPGKVTFTGTNASQLTDLFLELYYDELNHVIDLRNLLGTAVVGRQTINLAGTGTTTNTKTSYTPSEVIALARMLEDVSVTAFAGAAIYLKGSYLDYATRVLAADGFHAGALRLVSIQTGAQYWPPASSFAAVTTGGETAVNFTGVTVAGSGQIYALLGTVLPSAGNLLTGFGIPQGSGAAVTSVTPNSGVLTVKGNTSNGSFTILSVSPTTGLAVGQAITGTGVAANTIITAINGSTLTVSVPASANGTGVSLTVTSAGTPVKGSNVFGVAGTIPGVAIGQPVTGTNVPANSYITQISANSITLSQAASGSSTVTPSGYTTSGNKQISGVSSVNSVVPGASITGTNIPSGTTVVGVDPVASTITISASASGTSTVKPTGVVTAGSSQVTSLSSTSGLIVGQPISGTGIPANTFIGSVSGNTLTLADSTGKNPVLATANSAVTSSYTFSGIVTNGSPVILATGAFTGVVPGQAISGAGIPTGATITSVNVNASTVTISTNATASSTATFTGITYVGSPIISNVSSISGLVVGQPVTGPGVPPNSTISALSKTTDNPLTVTLSAPLTQINTAPVSFSSPSTITLTTKTSATTLTANSTVTLTIGTPVSLTIGQSIVNMAGAATATASNTIGVITADPMDVEPADPGDATTAAKGPQLIAGTSATPIYQGFFNTAGSANGSANAPAGFAFTRTFSQVLAVLVNTNTTNAIVTTQNYQGGYYPVGVSGNINAIA